MNLKALREKRGMSRKTLACLTGISFRSIQDYEQGHKKLEGARADTVLKIARSLGVSVEELFSEVSYGDLASFSESGLSGGKASESGLSGGKASECGLSGDEASECGLSGGETSEIKAHDSQKEVIKDLNIQNEEFPGERLPEGIIPFYLMHKDDIVLKALFETDQGSLICVEKLYNELLLPYATEKGELKRWWLKRAVSSRQGKMGRILSHIGFLTPQAYLLKNMGLSLCDSYWVKPVNTLLKWEDVSLFTNDFNDYVGKAQFEDLDTDLDFRNFDVRFPSSAAGGLSPKYWMCGEDSKRLLVKGPSDGNPQQIFNEVSASYMHRKQDRFEVCDYEFYNLKGKDNSLGAVCQAFTDENLEFIPASSIIAYEKGKNDYEKFVNGAVKNGLSEESVRDFLDYQILTDFAITNTDRNYENFGVLRNSQSLKFEKMAPMFDFSNSMFYDLDMTKGTLDVKNISVNSFEKNETGLLRLVKNRSLVDIDLLMTNDEIGEILKASGRSPEETKVLLTVYNLKKELLMRLKRNDLKWMD